MENGKWRARSRGWPRSSRYVVGTAPVLHEKQRKPATGTARSVTHCSGTRPRTGLVADPLVEAVDEALEERHAADLVAQSSRSRTSPANSTALAGTRGAPSCVAG